MIDFQDNDVMVVTYWVFDTVNYTSIGEWEMRGRNVLYMNVDGVINGDFDFERTKRKYWKLVAEENIAQILTTTVKVHLEIDIVRQ